MLSFLVVMLFGMRARMFLTEQHYPIRNKTTYLPLYRHFLVYGLLSFWLFFVKRYLHSVSFYINLCLCRFLLSS